MSAEMITITLLLAAAVRLSAPMLLASLGELVSERAGVINIGLEGMMLFGAYGAVLGLQQTGSQTIGLLAGSLWGLGVAALLALAVALLRADQIVTGIGFNILALGATSLLRQETLNPDYAVPSLRAISIYHIPGLWHLPVAGRGLFAQSPIFYGGVVVAVLLLLTVKFTRLGLIIRAVGEGAGAADAAGVSVSLVRFCVICFTGLCAGVAGSYLSLVASGGVFVDNITGGRGYLAVAVVIFSRWNPLWVLLASILFGFADALQYQGQAIGLALSPPLLLMSPFVLALLALLAWVLMGKGKGGPSEIGQPFLRGRK